MSGTSTIRSLAEMDPSWDASDELKVAILLWSGEYGGAETWSVALAHALLHENIRAGLVVIGHSGPVCGREKLRGLPLETLGLARGSKVLTHPRSLAAVTTRMGPDAAITPSAGYLSAALRGGGYAGKILAVEHGTLLQLPAMPWATRSLRLLDWVSGLWAVDAQVTPSDYMHRALLRFPHRRTTSHIHLGLDLASYPAPPPAMRGTHDVVVGFAGRLIPGKGVDTLLRAAASGAAADGYRVEIAGDGPERAALEDMARDLGIQDRVRFRGWVSDVPAFWRACQVAVVPSNQWIESFGMVAIEAMATGLPVIASRSGALPEIVRDGETGALFGPGDWEDLSRRLTFYARDPDLRQRHGYAARRRCESEFSIQRCAREYARLIRSQVRNGAAAPREPRR